MYLKSLRKQDKNNPSGNMPRCKARRGLHEDLGFAWPLPLIHFNNFCKSFTVHQCAY